MNIRWESGIEISPGNHMYPQHDSPSRKKNVSTYDTIIINIMHGRFHCFLFWFAFRVFTFLLHILILLIMLYIQSQAMTTTIGTFVVSIIRERKRSTELTVNETIRTIQLMSVDLSVTGGRTVSSCYLWLLYSTRQRLMMIPTQDTAHNDREKNKRIQMCLLCSLYSFAHWQPFS